MRFVRAFVAVATMIGTVALATVQPATAATSKAQALTTITAANAGSTSDTAAGSCWEIKQLNPSSTSGVYWVLTPAMAAPQQVYCDQTNAGGGWELIGKGRDQWDKSDAGQGKASALLTPDTTPMTGTTVQYPSSTVDGLLNNGRVDALSDGVRVRRAMDAAGTNWQEVRMNFSRFPHWAWALGALYPLSTWSATPTSPGGSSTASGTGGTSQSFGTGSSYSKVSQVPGTSNDWSYGFAYGSSVVGTSADTSYLWSPTNAGGATPYATVWVRPHVTSTDAGFTAIPGSGTSATTIPSVAQSAALDDPWGVTGLAGSTSLEGDVEVQAFTQSGNYMYVGGNFATVEQDASGTNAVSQPFLAAFDINTGQWLSSFRPQLNDNVMSLATLPNGDVVAGGQFTQANGAPATEIVALNPITGATDTNWKLTILNLKTAGVVQINALKVYESYLYIGGSFTHMIGGSKPNRQVYTSNLGRVDVADGTPDNTWQGNLNGTVNDIAGANQAGQDRIYAAGYFGQYGTRATDTPVATESAVALQTAAGAPLATPAWAPTASTWSNTKNDYQRAVEAVGNKVWVGGSEHSLFQFDPSTFQRTWGDIMYDKGDVQAISSYNNTVYAGCHCNYFDYANAYTWPTLPNNWTQANGMEFFGAWDATTGARITQFMPHMQMRQGTGIWAIQTDSNGTTWAGGDIQTVTSQTKKNAFAGGFARWPLNDSTAPGTPTNFQVQSQTGSTVTLGWNAVSDPSGVTYQILRDDRPIATTTSTSITVPKSTSGRFFVRAADGSGNVGASTGVLVVGNGDVPPTAAFTWSADHSTVKVDGSSSTSSDGSITDYLWDFGDGTGAHGATFNHTYTAAGSYIVKLTVTDGDGTTGSVSQTVTVGTPAANAAPTDVYGKQIYQDSPWVYYRLGETTRTSNAADAGPDNRTGTYNSNTGITYGTAGALANSTNTSITIGGSSSSGYVSSPKTTTAPATFSIEVWFKSTSTQGGRLIGYSSSSSGSSSNYDRMIYLQNSGQLVFGAYTSVENEVQSPASTPYNNGQWHMAVATMSPTDGMKLYVDGVLVGTNPNGTAQNYVGYWRVGPDNVWEGASSKYLNGSLDEAAVFNSVLTPAQIQTEYTNGSTVIGGGTNNPPTAAFSAGVTNNSVHFDAGTSSDSDGTITSYAWTFGDGATGSGQITDHTYANPGTYTATLTVKDDDGATATTQQQVTVLAPPVSTVVVADNASWLYKYDSTATPSGWNGIAFNDSAWSSGAAPLGFGSASIATNLDTFGATSNRPITSYYRKSFQITDKTQVTSLVLNTAADDGVVVYVNGTEVGRGNMPAGNVTSSTYASTSVKTANAAPMTITVPKNLLVNGTNEIAAETHLNYRGTADMSFHLKATLTTQSTGDSDQPPVAAFTPTMNGLAGSFNGSASSDPDGTIEAYDWNFGDGTAHATTMNATHTYANAGSYTVTLTVTDDEGSSTSLSQVVNATSPTSVIIPNGSIWSWKYDNTALPSNWNSPSFDASGWQSGAGLFGFGNAGVVTNIDTFADPSTRPIASYYTKQFQVADASKVTQLTLNTVADDGIVVYVNGVEVGRTNMPAGTITGSTYASSAVKTASAQQVTINVPTSLLVSGTNVVSAETHVNYRKTPDSTFDLKATLTVSQ
ncbi:MAG: PKD domain-containing protein [Nocardioides sp.]